MGKNKTEQYKKMLRQFASLDQVFLVREETGRSNGGLFMALTQDRSLIEEIDISCVKPIEGNRILKKIALSDLKEALLAAPKIEFFGNSLENCDACEGNGEVSVDYSHNGDLYELSGECPVCNGSGTSGKIIKHKNKTDIDRAACAKIADYFIDMKAIEQLILTAEILKESTIYFCGADQNNHLLFFHIGQVEIAIAGTLPSIAERIGIVFEIKLKDD